LLILAAHTSTPALGVAITQDGKIIAEEVLKPGKEHLENISGVIQKILSETGLELSDFDGLGVAIGPGSFSGIRVGLSVFKGLAMALDTKIIGVSTLEILTWQAAEISAVAVPLLDAGRGEVYVGVFKKVPEGVQVIQSVRLLNKEEIEGFVSKQNLHEMVLCGAPELLEAIVQGTTMSVKAIATPSPGACGTLAEKGLERGASDDIHSLVPLYVRRSDAEEKKGIADALNK